MKKNGSKIKNILSLIFSIFLIFLAIGLLSYFVFDQYSHTIIKEEALEQVQETFESYSRSKSSYKIHCKSENIYRITKILIKEDEIDSILADDVLLLGIRKNEIIVISVNDKALITIEECHSRYRDQMNITIIVVSLLAVLLISLGIFLFYFSKKPYKRNLSKRVINEKLQKEILSSIVQENGIYRCDILEKIEEDDSEYTLYCALKEFLEEDELVFMIDQAGKEDGLALIFYRLENNISFEEAYLEEDGSYELDDMLFWWYPSMEEATKVEQEKYRKAIERFNLYHEGLLKISPIK